MSVKPVLQTILITWFICTSSRISCATSIQWGIGIVILCIRCVSLPPRKLMYFRCMWRVNRVFVMRLVCFVPVVSTLCACNWKKNLRELVLKKKKKKTFFVTGDDGSWYLRNMAIHDAPLEIKCIIMVEANVKKITVILVSFHGMPMSWKRKMGE